MYIFTYIENISPTEAALYEQIELATSGAKRIYLYNMFPVIPTEDGSSQIQGRRQDISTRSSQVMSWSDSLLLSKILQGSL